MTTINDANAFLMGGGGAPSAKFPNVGDTHKGTVVAAEVNQQTDLDGNLKFFSDGQPMRQLVITIQTDERDPSIDDDDGTRRLFAKGGPSSPEGKAMLDAIREAIRNAGRAEIELGATIAVQYVADGERKKAGHHPPKLYRASYKPPAVGVDDLLADTPAPAPAPTADSLV